MARAKTSTRKSKNVLDQDRYTAELSTGQLVIGVCILLMFGLACFLLGVIIGKFDPTLHPEMAEQSSPSIEPSETPGTEAAPQAVARKQQPLAGPVTTPPRPEMRVPLNTSSQNAPTKPVASQAANSAAKEAPTPSTPEKTETKPDTPAKTEDGSNATVVAKETAPPPPAQPVATPVVRARFSVQIAAFNTRQRAEVVKNELETKSDYKAELVVSSTGKLVKVMVGSFAEKISADKVHSDLRDNFQYKDCFVVSR